MDGDFNCARWKSDAALLNQRVCKIQLNPDFYEPRLLDYVLPVYLRAINEHTSSVTVKHLSSRTIEALELPFPPRLEQTRIADTLDELVGLIARAESDLLSAKRKLALYRQALLKAAVEGALTAGWRGEDSLATWQTRTIDEIATVGTGTTPSRSNPRNFQGGNVPWITSGALNAERVDRADEFVTREALDTFRLTLYPPGTLLVAMYGEGRTRGKCAELAIEATVNQAVAAIVLRPEYAHARAYLRIFLWHSYESMRDLAAGGVQPNLNLRIIKSIRVPLPPPTEQREIVARLEEQMQGIRQQQVALDRALALAAAQRQNILRAAFSGRLVPQDPADEPARVLLERIHAERQQSAARGASARRARRAAC